MLRDVDLATASGKERVKRLFAGTFAGYAMVARTSGHLSEGSAADKLITELRSEAPSLTFVRDV